MPFRRTWFLGLTAAAAAMTVAATGARADPVKFGSVVGFNDFSSIGGLINLQGSATTVATANGAVLSLTQGTTQNQAGSAILASPFALGPDGAFNASFRFQITPGPSGPADGFTFVLQQGAASSPQPGGNLGYYGTPNSVAIEFDTYNNLSPTTGGGPISQGGAGDVNDNHVAVDVNGLLNDFASASPYGVGTNSPWACNSATNGAGCLANGDIWSAMVSYAHGKLNVTVQDGGASPDTVINGYAIDLPNVLGTNAPYIGFTGGDGGLTSSQQILSLNVAAAIHDPPPPLPAPVSEPGSLALFASGVAALVVWRRRRARA